MHSNALKHISISRKNSHTNAALVGIVVVVSQLSGCGQKEAIDNPVRPALVIKLGATNGADVDVFAGEIRARVESDHAFRMGGKIAKRLVDAGAVVKRGQPLAQLDPQDVTLASQAARAQVAALQTEADFADAELKRFQNLKAQGFVSQSALDQRTNHANAAHARLEAQKASANVALNQAGYATLVADMDGVVTTLMAEAGQVVGAGQPVMRLANPRERELVIAIPESALPTFRSAQRQMGTREILVCLWNNPDKKYKARVREIGGAADPATRTYSGRISIEGAGEEVGLGMSAYATFAGQTAIGTFAVPLSALYVKGNTTGIWQVQKNGKVSLKAVTVLQYRETTALIRTDAVKVGDDIIAAGVHKLREGEVVKPLVDPAVKGDGRVAYAAVPPQQVVAPQTAWMQSLQRFLP
jgi:membrane fusion protein, multidrug efflux system